MILEQQQDGVGDQGTKMGVIKVGVVTDDGRTISSHFGRARYYLVYEIEGGIVNGKELRPKATHHHGGEDRSGVGEAALHDNMLANVRDCEALIAGGMGWPMYESIRSLGIRPLITTEAGADDAVQAYLRGALDDHQERLH